MDKNEIILKLKNTSTSPGVYLWKDAKQNVLYVGKAKNLRKRLLQYFDGAINSYKTSKLMSLVADFEVYICKTNKEALLLEKAMVDRFNPEFNILLLDDRKYPYLKVQLLKDSLLITLSRKVNTKYTKNTLYYGPFPSGYGAKPILKLLQHEALYESGLLIKNNDSSFWVNQFAKIKEILSFKNNNYLNELTNKMHTAANNMQFELALFLRDGLTYLKKLKESQIIELSQYKNIDVFAYKTDEKLIYATVLFYRYGVLINKVNLTIPLGISIDESIRVFFEQFYADKILPDNFIVQEEILKYDLNLSSDYKFISPKIGTNKKVLDLALLNLNDYYEKEHLIMQNQLEKADSMLSSLNKYLNLPKLKNIVIFDNSNINNINPVGVAIVYTNGIKNKSLYRKFNLEALSYRSADVDYIRQSITKFFSSDKNTKDFDLIITDGGLQQVNEAKKTLKVLGINIPVIGLVKNEYHKTRALIDLNLNEIYVNDLELHNYLAQIQIEVDRFAKSHFRNRQKISSLEGKLRNIKGLGHNMEQKLLNHFKSYAKIYDASVEELAKIVPFNVAKSIKNKDYE
ncbi:excinuclease ABC subunit C [Mycoplasmopsis agalactiae]|uniref:UvrABC system protein C n=2 Tax=Mycoplasmopsis agalactiae TaxID=2110 RepID=UVRC_MYCAP|nr:GIY-YIG nuclease family protein [Mycoplasmopsis agalactiae]O84899.1 RecName: Full=UvrABC system protein C; Short=Protein UvrC; AltName: Full=Excinuclease ABC subunit C [Mycoplasmopsis agalactiae PG2]AAC32310.1 deoxyribodipyrimidine photolyase [Mycoplasmopsis agalactiae PG2]QYR08672.1 excinuclease ABC subunit C [Mycoplasmopsis agalactiae]CAL59200.1 UvrABC system protein C [Mycoplasmopsis agalactiae PG2]